MKFKKIIITILALSIFIFGIYLYKLHALAIEGDKIFEYRCLKVNPPLISYKNSFLKFADYLKNPDKYSSDQVKDFFDEYIAGMRKYVDEEKKWLEMEKKYMDSWDFKLIEPWYIKDGAEYQWKMYEGYRDDAKYLLVTFDQKKATRENDAKQKEARDRRDKYSKLYFDHIEMASKINDWRKVFGSVPFPKGCTEENLTIPNTTGSIDWDGDSASPSPTTTPINDEIP